MSNNIIIFDTTLRDGEQALQASLSIKEKLQIAYALERLGVDVIEAGFPVSSPGDFKSVQAIAKEIKIAVYVVWHAVLITTLILPLKHLTLPIVSGYIFFLATSSLHIEHKLKRSFNDILALTSHSIKHARNYTDDIEFSCEDAGRTEPDNLCRIVEMAINAGATTINIPDTVGYTIPSQFGNIIKDLLIGYQTSIKPLFLSTVMMI